MIDHSRGCQGREYACSCGYDNHTGDIKERYSRLIGSMRTRLTDQITPLASKHTIGSLLAEIGESQ